MSFICRETKCNELAKFQCLCKAELRFCSKHLPQHKKTCRSPSKSIEHELKEALKSSKKGIKILNRISSQLIILSETLISSIKQSASNSLKIINDQKSKISSWVLNFNSDSLENEISLLKKIKLNKRDCSVIINLLIKLLDINDNGNYNENECGFPEHQILNEKYEEALGKLKEYEDIIEDYNEQKSQLKKIRREHRRSVKIMKTTSLKDFFYDTESNAPMHIKNLTKIIEETARENEDLKERCQEYLQNLEFAICNSERLADENEKIESKSVKTAQNNEESNKKIQESIKKVQEIDKKFQDCNKKLQNSIKEAQETDKKFQDCNKKLQNSIKESQDLKRKIQEMTLKAQINYSVTFENQRFKGVYDNLKNLGLPGFKDLDQSNSRIIEVIITRDQRYGFIFCSRYIDSIEYLECFYYVSSSLYSECTLYLDRIIYVGNFHVEGSAYLGTIYTDRINYSGLKVYDIEFNAILYDGSKMSAEAEDLLNQFQEFNPLVALLGNHLLIFNN
ncbi:hypothetical protein SteCoe_37402 [Stentor coeruleus]|uniref:Uncharacterized protein n=1 Tax=Stentor coeruleus TaxID=5963 RepID=A0A1R2AN29_9CILI|nr:hypothetical protein SteCoe_37402 [Stentor coeruleus]